MNTNSSDIVISGVAGRFPKSNNVQEYESNLLNKVYMIDGSADRVKWKFPNQPTKFGFINNLNKFDYEAFRVPPFLSKSLDPQGRMLLEHVYEAVLDAGVCPNTLMGTKTGVYVGCFNYDSLDFWLYDKATRYGLGSVGNGAYALANRLSFALGVQGPSLAIDTACSSSLYALTLAFNDIKNGHCDAAIVAGTNLILSPMPTEDYTRAGILATNGISQPFDKNSSGFVRAEACCAIYLQKVGNAKRVYATIVDSKTNNDGFKREGPMVPSANVQKKLYESVYGDERVDIDINLIDYIEAHATSTLVGDKQEVASIDEYFCKNRKTPLKIGSVKSNMGHAEGAAGLTSLVKSLLMFENQRTYPNLNLTILRDDCPAFIEKRIEVVQEVEDFDGNYIGVNSFGVLGANAHTLIKRNENVKINGGFPSDALPRLLTWSGRTKEAVGAIFDRIAAMPIDDEFLALLQCSQSESMPACLTRGFGIFKFNSDDRSTIEVDRKIDDFDGIERPIVFVYSGVGSQWLKMGADLMKIPFIAERIDECHEILSSEEIDLKKILTSDDPKTFSNCTNIFVGVVAIQIALTDLLKLIGIVPDYLIGHSVGELACAYADGTLTAKETLLSAYLRGVAITSVERAEGAMAAVAIGFKELKDIIPDGIEIACHNSSESCTISGNRETVERFVGDLKSKEVLAKILDSGGQAFHSSYIADSFPILLSKLKSLISDPKERSKNWISTSIAKDKWKDDLARFSSAEYHANNMLSPVLFEEAAMNLPDKSLLIEIAPHAILQSIVKKCFVNGKYVSLLKRDVEDGSIFLLQSLGDIHRRGVNIDVRQIYPQIEFPVSRGTAMISPLISWNHSEDLFVPIYDSFTQCDKRSIFMTLSDLKYNYMKGHQLGGRVILPAAGYLYLVWETFAMMHCADMNEFPICFEEVKYLRATMLQQEHETELTINIQRGSGYFEIIDVSTTVASGYVKGGTSEKLISDGWRFLNEGNVHSQADEWDTINSLHRKDFYKELRLRGYEYGYDFKSLDSIARLNDYQIKGKIEWKSNWVTFIDCMLQATILYEDSRELFLPIHIRKLVIDPKKHEEHITIENENSEKSKDGAKKRCLVEFQGDTRLKCIRSGGIEVIDLKASFVTKLGLAIQPTMNAYKFVSHFPTPPLTKFDAANFCTQLFMEITPSLKITIAELDHGNEPMIESFVKCLEKVPLVMTEFQYFSKPENVEMEGVKISTDELATCNILIKQNALNNENVAEIFEKINENGLLLSRQWQLIDNLQLPENLQCIAVVTSENEFVYVINKTQTLVGEIPFTIPSGLENFEWIRELQKRVREKDSKVLLVSKSDENWSGVLGFVNCLRKEPRIKNLRCVLVDDECAPEFTLDNTFYKHQLSLGLPLNVFKDGKWGSYRHLSLPAMALKKSNSHHTFVNLLTRGDISSLTWVGGNLNVERDDLIEVHFAALNYRDILTATKRIILDHEFENRIDRQYLCGYEFSGIAKDGRRVMGMVKSKGIANFVAASDSQTVEIPNNWTLQEAATVILTYTTTYLAFFHCTQIEKGKSILIHAGSGGVGTAAIRVALGYGLKVFTTVGSEEKREYLLNEFPELSSESIGNSRDTSFETMIMEGTNGKGVNYVLNSLAEDKMQASIRCVADGGTFLEVGKFDMQMGSQISLNHFLRGITFKAVLLDLAELINSDKGSEMAYQMRNDMISGIIKPLKTNVFAANEVDKALRFFASSKHIGKVLINVKDHGESVENPTSIIEVQPRVYFDQEKSYIIPGGLGGMGMEIVDWMILRECRKIVLSSSRGISSSYQTYRLNLWKTYGVEVVISTADITTRLGCEELVQLAIKLGPVGGIFNLAGVIDDSLFEKMDENSFLKVLKPKSHSTMHLDEVSRRLCPQLDHFVVFSSVSCGYGNAGQTNYGFANSIAERIVEKRRRNGFPGKAIQWGPVNDVGMIMTKANEDKEVTSMFGMIPQKIYSCYDSLNSILSCDETIVSSVVVAEKKNIVGDEKEFLANLLMAMGITNVKSIDRNKPIGELGMDSIGGTEIQQGLEREFGIIMTFQELKTKTLTQIESLIKGRKSNSQTYESTSFMDSLWKDVESGVTNDDLIEELKSVEGKPKILLFPGMIGSMGSIWQELEYSIYVVHHIKFYYLESFDELFNAIIGDLLELYKDDNEFILVGYSFGSTLALRTCELFESMGKQGKLVVIDGAPPMMRSIISESVPNEPTDEDYQTYILNEVAKVTYGTMAAEVLRKVYTQTDWKARVNEFVEFIRTEQGQEFVRKNLESLFNRLKMIMKENFNFTITENVNVVLIKPQEISSIISQDYGLREYGGEIRIESVPGDHLTVIESPGILNIINSI